MQILLTSKSLLPNTRVHMVIHIFVVSRFTKKLASAQLEEFLKNIFWSGCQIKFATSTRSKDKPPRNILLAIMTFISAPELKEAGHKKRNNLNHLYRWSSSFMSGEENHLFVSLQPGHVV